jgi:hypothetical protein
LLRVFLSFQFLALCQHLWFVTYLCLTQD